MFEIIGTLAIIAILLALIICIMRQGSHGTGPRAGYFYRPQNNNLDHLTDTEFFEPMQPPEVEYGLGPDPYDPKHRSK